ncbi:ABC transporter ATP-binding protein [Listeria ivanovii]|uniref:Putative ABC transporter, ATP-binding protein n=1 Tax=Listeria ivanovii (strain ATCC BAA-678 / PAM 55) TaxID=881621 RepID=G2ZCE2_LISIP|nr:ABC transporter ATP-binding protein [Listeria ivanovii]AHI55123.1 ABC transporter [Listeria ivanovii WSLC3009]AIS64582.1 ABC transporter [Listeria ivanovii subsp. ivanovii]MBC1758747.1 ABC transporter ATP-binding protein [Listeria ivanovii]MBK3913605.1 ABC transporter ATP-binding protein [Listeria ivanovii subsp. ivanovii]MBK3920277.1 ABC transporter ATP-binding protein [Listeria ivanovii subsp. ivanovii]
MSAATPGPGGGMRMQTNAKPKNFKQTLFRLLGYMKPRSVAIIVVFIFAILSTIFNIFSPKELGKATTEIFKGVMSPAGIDNDKIFNILMIVLVLYLGSSLFSFIQQYVMSSVAQRTVYDMRKDLKAKMARLPLKYYDTRSNGDILSRSVNDMDNIANTLQQSLTQAITAIVQMIGVLIMMLTISWQMTLIVLVTVPISIILVAIIAGRSQRYFGAQQRNLGILNDTVEETYGGQTIIKAFGQEKKTLVKFDEVNDDYFKAAKKAQFISGIMMPVMQFVGNLGYVGVCVAGGIFVTNGTLQVGDIQSFTQYVQLFTQPISSVANIANIIQSTIASAERVFEMMDEEEEKDEIPANINQVAGEENSIVFDHVKFGYTPDKPLMTDLNIHVEEGQMVAIVGPTGAGKTTIINLLMRFYDVDGGSIRMKGIDTRDMTKDAVREKFGMVLQDTWLFNGTIADNIAYGREGATKEEVIGAAKAAYADDFIRRLPNGYDTVLNEEGSNISQGQKQLLTIARAILSDPSILILDEATSSVDTRTELNIQLAMGNLMEGRTSFVIAHRLSTIRDADLILVMNHGSVIEQGTHKDLLDAKGFYADLYNSQFTGAQAV